MENKKEIKNKIEEELLNTEKLILKYKELTQPIAPDCSIGRVSRMDAINNKSVNQLALRNAEAKFKNLNTALSKINDSDFGICVRCNKPIPLGRILLMPQVVTCVSCTR